MVAQSVYRDMRHSPPESRVAKKIRKRSKIGAKSTSFADRSYVLSVRMHYQQFCYSKRYNISLSSVNQFSRSLENVCISRDHRVSDTLTGGDRVNGGVVLGKSL